MCCRCVAAQLARDMRGEAWHTHPSAPSRPCCDAGGFVDDYRLDEEFRNDLGFLYCCHVSDGLPAVLELVPTQIVHTWQVEEQIICANTACRVWQNQGVTRKGSHFHLAPAQGDPAPARRAARGLRLPGGAASLLEADPLFGQLLPLLLLLVPSKPSRLRPPAELRPATLSVGSAHSPQPGCTLAAHPSQGALQGVWYTGARRPGRAPNHSAAGQPGSGRCRGHSGRQRGNRWRQQWAALPPHQAAGAGTMSC